VLPDYKDIFGALQNKRVPRAPSCKGAKSNHVATEAAANNTVLGHGRSSSGRSGA